MALRLGMTLGQTILAIAHDLRAYGRKVELIQDDIAALAAAPRTALRNRLKAGLQARADELAALAADIDAL